MEGVTEPCFRDLVLARNDPGALGGALTLAARRSIGGLERLVAGSIAGFSVALIAFSLSRTLALSTLLIVPAGYTIMIQMSGSNTLLQTIVPDALRGRVMSFFSLCLMGISPIGSLIAGSVAARVGAPIAVAGSGTICLAGALVFRRYLPEIGRLTGSREAEEPDLSLLDEPSIPPEASAGFP